MGVTSETLDSRNRGFCEHSEEQLNRNWSSREWWNAASGSRSREWLDLIGILESFNLLPEQRMVSWSCDTVMFVDEENFVIRGYFCTMVPQFLYFAPESNIFLYFQLISKDQREKKIFISVHHLSATISIPSNKYFLHFLFFSLIIYNSYSKHLLIK